ncbi:MAG TPA: MoxR family ATPase [Syntrophales bacterium]|jgi:MoxR-like ATPase|nr:MoxR family ATPase [Syntrophales bacterium]HON23047.1 MoxR family ATPase [Syntrophales bacterium]HOU77745.1 MoxR family ATPase [Syntrophales bacterium]HPC32844.1 MoxR family ATPase [Syntrophales bacterium]HQG34876.1 MoxR family ATPase [Syntrophales bacterium]
MSKRYEERMISIETVEAGLRGVAYIPSRQIAATVYLAHHLEKPILVEGPAGVGKTELAKAAADYLQLPLIRLQCYEGLDEAKALYEWKYGKQLLYTQLLRDKLDDIISRKNGFASAMEKLHQYDDIFFSWPFLEPRPLLKALQEKDGAVLLIDEVDKSDDEFEAFLLEILSEYQVSVPEIGTVKAVTKPLVFLTSNNTRELSEALKRRCLHLFIPFPEAALEREIVCRRVPGISARLARQIVKFIQDVRELELKKVPSISETIDWARVLMILHAEVLDPVLVRETLNTFIKFEDDVGIVTEKLHQLTALAVRP